MSQTQYRRPSDEEYLALARSLAKVAHSGQTRRGGEDYFDAHVERVAEYAREHRGLRAARLGYLHDTVEDTTVTLNTLRELGFPALDVHDVALLTHNPDEAYLHYIGRIVEFASDDAVEVKLADLALNMPGASERKRELYLVAQQHLLAEQDRRAAVRDYAEMRSAARAA